MPAAATGTKTVPSILAELERETANALALYLNYKKYHWQMTGPLFRDLHLLFDEHATQILEGVDELGERIQILGGVAPHHPTQISSRASVRLSEVGSQTPAAIVEEALENHTRVIEGMRSSISHAIDANDPGSADLLTRLVQMHEKQAWFLRQIKNREKSLL